MDGYLLLHGKGSGPRLPACVMNPLANKMQEDGLLLEHNHMSWGLGSLYFHHIDESLNDIAQGIERLKSQGATRIHLVGHSLGANVAFYYASKFINFTSIVALAPAHNTHIAKFNQWSNWSRNKAQSLISQGQDGPADFIDVSMLDVYIINCIPSAYLSYLDPMGDSVMTKNVRRFKQPVNLFIGTGVKDTTQLNARGLLYDPAKKTQHSTILESDDDHFTIPINSYPIWRAWCEGLPD